MSTPSDISWSGPAGTVNLRVAAVVFRGDQVLPRTVGSLDFRPFGLVATLAGHGEVLRHVVLDRLDGTRS